MPLIFTLYAILVWKGYEYETWVDRALSSLSQPLCECRLRRTGLEISRPGLVARPSEILLWNMAKTFSDIFHPV